MTVTVFLTLAVIVAAIVIGTPIIRNMVGGGNLVCTRCDGTGQVNEKWPDPSEPTGWHRVEGVCPKCKGKGRIRTR